MSSSKGQRIVLACQKVKSLTVNCITTSQSAIVGALLGNTVSVVNEVYLNERFRRIDEEDLASIADGLVGNTTLKKLSIPHYSGSWSSITNVLCNTSSIYHIRNSNHTLKTFEIIWREIGGVEFSQIRHCLKLNKYVDKSKVIRKKIARYYFVGNFDVTPFTNMAVSVLPRVLAMIEGDAMDRQYAIFRLLRSIPGLCSFRVVM